MLRSSKPWPTTCTGRCWPIPARVAASPARSPPPMPLSGPGRPHPRRSCSWGHPGCPRPWVSTCRPQQTGCSGRRVDPWHQWTDPTRVATEFHHCDTDEWLATPIGSAEPADPAWLASWQAMEDAAQAALEETLAQELSEPQVARQLYAHAARNGDTIVVSASMPIRDLEWYGAPQRQPPRVLANRGTNGIDGVVSTALGVAAGTPEPSSTIALMGDLAFLHDVSGLVNFDPAARCTFVVVDNGGGGIFSFLPQATRARPRAFRDTLRYAASQRYRRGGARVRIDGTCGHDDGRVEGRPPSACSGRDPRPGPRAIGERRPARRDQPGGPSRAWVNVGEGVEVLIRPVGLLKVSSTLASPATVHPSSWTALWC